MNRIRWAAIGATLIAATAMAATWDENSGQRRKYGRGFSTSHDDPVNSCDDLRVSFGRGWYERQDFVRAERSVKLPVTAGRALAAEGSRNGGVYVIGSTAAEFEVQACFFATGDTRAEAEALLGRLALDANAARATVTGPGENDWVGFLIVRAPRGSAVEVSAWNGPVSVREFTGRVSVESRNGPVSIVDSIGDVVVETENGPIHVASSQGTFRVRAQNGPLHVDLRGTRWQSGSLDGSTQNGPIHLEVPEGYQSGVLVDVSRHSPVECRAAQCRQAVRTWERPNRIEFGGSPVVRLSTVNGPVTVSGND